MSATPLEQPAFAIKMNSECLTERHLLLFGIIIQWFAQYELLIQEIMATISGSDLSTIILLTRNLDFDNKRQALLKLLYRGKVPLNQYDRISIYLRVPYNFTSLRNHIAHATWVQSKIPNSIQPNWILKIPESVEPLCGDLNAYTIDDFEHVAQTLTTNHKQFLDYLLEISLIQSHSNQR